MSFTGETGVPLDESLIGPLSASIITDEPVAWGIDEDTRPVICADAATQAYIDRYGEELEAQAREIFDSEMQAMALSVADRTEPSSVLHGFLVFGTSSMTKIAGYIGRPVGEVTDKIDALTRLGVLRIDPATNSEMYPQYWVDLDSEPFTPAA